MPPRPRELLRFITAGSVDDGKSTLIGRLLHDSKSLFEDQIEAVRRAGGGADELNLALLTDGLRAEREQGITIGVAYRYFTTPKRKFIIADTPGHAQYTRNMVTGASTAHLALILVDARAGVVEQTRRHALIASLLQIPRIVLCVNKMDLVGYQESVFAGIRAAFEDFASKLEVRDLRFVPLSALRGDNVVERSAHMPWYQGETLLHLLENIHIASDPNHIDCRFPVQTVIRPQEGAHRDFRGYAGRVVSGVFKPGDRVLVLPKALPATIKSIETQEGPRPEAFAPMSVTLTFEEDLDVGRGDMVVREHNQPRVGQDLDLMLCWLDEKPMRPSGSYLLQHTTRLTRCRIQEILYTIDLETLHRRQGGAPFVMNDIGRVRLRSAEPLFHDPFRRNKTTGGLILIDEATGQTAAAGMLL